jgi:hypothetical protein
MRGVRNVGWAKRIHYLAVLILVAGLSGCAGTWVSSRPIYPDSWPALVVQDAGRTCPDLSGKYLAVSDEAAPLVYPPGGHPREMFMFISFGKPVPVPPLGCRLLPWHLAGVFKSKDSDRDVYSALTRYAATLEVDYDHCNPKDEAGWVQVQELSNSLIDVHVGIHDQTLINFVLKKESQGLWTYKSQIYECKGGGLSIIGGFPLPLAENPMGSTHDPGAVCTFFRAVDESLVMLEDPYFGPSKQSVVFRKWWRWRRIE